MTDGRGRRVDFTNAVIVLTSNLGASEVGAVRTERHVGFSRGRGAISNDKLAEVMTAAARAHLPPELWNRFDEVLAFAPLSRAEVATIAERLLEDLADGLAGRGIKLDVDPAAIEALLEETNRRTQPSRYCLDSLQYKVYVRDSADQRSVAAALSAALQESTRVVYLRADVCRDDLLVEIEATGESNHHGKVAA